MPSQLKTIFCCGLIFTSPALAQNASIETPTIKTQGVATTNSINTSAPSSMGLSTVNQSSAGTIGGSTVVQTNTSANDDGNQEENSSQGLPQLKAPAQPVDTNTAASRSLQITSDQNPSENKNPVNNSEGNGTSFRIISLSNGQEPGAQSNGVNRVNSGSTLIINNEVDNDEITGSISGNNTVGPNSSSSLNDRAIPDCNVVEVSRSVSRVDCR